jgi:Tol biopolymer transport system component
MKNKTLISLIIFASLFLLQNTGLPQFGKNKVQYKDFNWKYIQTEHFDIYFYDGGEYLADFTAAVAESSLVSLTKNIDYSISNRIPIVVFQSHNDFQQNNVLDEYLPEGVGGVTELFKNRVLVPFEGKYELFRHVIHHELLHAFMNDMYYGGSIQNIIARNITLAFPNWFAEGMAEFQSLSGLDKGEDMFMRDAVINNYLPPIEYCDGYLAYRAGQSFFTFLSDYYGEHKIGELMNNVKTFGSVDDGFKETYKLEVEKLSEKWLKELNKTYWSDSKSREEITDFAKPLTDHTKDGGFYNVAPVISPKGNRFAFISNRDDFFDVFIADVKTGKVIKKLIAGNTSSNFEELQILTPGLSWSPDERKIAISVKAGSKDAIQIIDVEDEDDVTLPIQLNSISNVTWGFNYDQLFFIGTNGKQSDVYFYNMNTKELENLTNDIFSDYNPACTPDGKYVYFCSDRGDYLNSSMIPSDYKIFDNDFKTSDIYRINLSSKEIERVTKIKNAKQSYPQFSEDGRRMLYVSDVSGISNVYVREADSNGVSTDRPITNSLNPIDQISLSRDGKKLLFISLNKGGFDVFSMENPLYRDIGKNELEYTDFVKNNILNIKKVSYNRDSLKIRDTLNTNRDTVSIYGEDVKINFKYNKDTSKQIAVYDTAYINNMKFKIENNKNTDGTFKINNYKVKFSPDLVYGNANYSSYYGVQGVAQIALSDMLGDHRVYIQTSMVIDLKNSDYAAAYYYLPKRIDWGFEIYHTARFLLYDKGYGDELYRFINWGGDINFQYPISKFRRVDGGLAVMNISQENLDFPEEPISRKTFIVPSLSFVFDNTLMGYTAPVKGSRYNLTTLGTPRLSNDGVGFASLIGDFRHYFKFGEDYSLALRFTGGGSIGPNPQRFYLGGTDNWINYDFENRNIPISNVEEFAFSSPIYPLRGYNFDRISGSKYALANIELRYPLFKYLIFGLLPIGFQDIKGVMFFDAGTAWRNNKDLKLFESVNGSTQTRDLLMGMGFGTRIAFMGFPVKFDVAWSYNLKKFSAPKYYISLGYDF